MSRKYRYWVDGKRRQRVIRDKKSEDIGEFEMNKIYRSFELIGIYESFVGEEKDFHEFYKKKTSEQKFCYRNHGINIIYNLLDKEKSFDELDYRVSKKSMRRTGLSVVTVRAYEGTEIFVNRIIKYIKENKFLENFYLEHIHKKDIAEYLLSQNDLIDWHIEHRKGGKAKYFGNMKTEIGEAIKWEKKEENK